MVGRQIGIAYWQDMAEGTWIELGNTFEPDGTGVFEPPAPLRRLRPTGFYLAFLRP